MVFNSFSFLFAYLPIVLILFVLSRKYLGKQWADLCLIVASLIFYGWNYPKCLPVLLGSLIVNYAWGCLLYKDLMKKLNTAKEKTAKEKTAKEKTAKEKTTKEKTTRKKTTGEKTAGKTVEKTGSVSNNSDKKKKYLLGAGIVLNVAVLCFFKYARLLPVFQGIELDAPGISFFTFTQIAFLVETYRGNVVPMGMREYGLYVSSCCRRIFRNSGVMKKPQNSEAMKNRQKERKSEHGRFLKILRYALHKQRMNGGRSSCAM